jgi:pSer/pThr/pTyr-binding forkhead associated (FHA) protein
MNDCSIKFDDQNLSRYQCFISFDQRWFIQDGDGNKCSTNGTWMFGEDFVEISNGMVFKVAETLVKVVNMQVILDYEEL